MNFGLFLTKTYSEYFGSGHYYEFGAQKDLMRRHPDHMK